ncbi:MAG: DNA-directed RNA polymerase subunit beta' [Anaerolineae bacterium]|nr:DNA-directed RNA polymerase subunit beta' [Anaerolineae bacterium]
MLKAKDFVALRISLASPERIKSWSYGEVTKPETINYRRLRPEKDGLFCEAIFGPTKDWQCYCGKYKNVRYKGIVCDKCGVEVTRSAVRRERMGHIELAAPVAHIWYTRRVPSYLGVLLDVSRRHLDRVLYFAEYVITEVDEDARQRALRRLDEEEERETSRLQKAVQEQIDAIETRLAEEQARLEGEREAGRQRREEHRDRETENIVQEAQTLQARLEREQGKKASASVSLSFSDQVIVAKGEEVTRGHLDLLNALVQERLSEIKAELEQEQTRDEALIQLELERLRQEADEKIAELQAQLSADLEALHRRIGDAREELRNLAPMQFLNEVEYRDLKSRWGQVFKAGMGAEAFYGILQRMDLDKLSKELWDEIRTTRSKQRRQKATKRLRVVEALRKSGNRPEWMILTVLPVIPPDLRPMVQLDGGRFATSDLNDLYRRVINRNNRLKRLLELDAPDVIIRNEKRMLQEAVDSLIDNSRRGKALSRRGRRELKSLSDMLKGKKGRFRRNLLGKRVDYSGRSVIVIGPELKLHQCGLPKSMALELYRPFVIAKLVEYNYASNVKGAKRVIERERPEVWEVLEEVIKERPVLLNRAPTLHRLGIQAFEPVLVEGKAIQIHPLVCAAFNADFDGDQMAVHVPLSRQAVEEARKLMLSTRNLLLPASGEPIVGPTKDMVLGCYYLTMERDGCKGEGMVFSDLDEVELAYSLNKVELHARIQVHTRTHYNAAGERYKDGRSWARLIETTVGRVLFNQILPEELRYVNEVLDKGRLKELVAKCYRLLGLEATAQLVDRIKDIGFQYATRSGASIAVSDFTIPKAKDEILQRIAEQVHEVERQYRRGLLTEDEQYARTIELWTQATDQVTDAVAESLDPTGPIYIMAESGSTKGGFQPIRQLAGMRGLMADPAGRIIDLPIRSNFREGLTALEYFISTHGARKGLADTALRTADAGYLTRRLVDVAQDVIINAEDCGTRNGIWVRASDNVGGQSLGERIVGRIAAGPVVDPKTGEILVDKGEMIEEDQAEAIEAAGIEEVYVRSPLTCQLRYGLCAKCYGRDLGRGELVEVGAAVGIVAAQSIGEPGTQLTLRTFHTGGVAGTADITHGLPRVEELFEARKHPKGEAIISDIDGIVEIRKEGGVRLLKVIDSQVLRDEYDIKHGWKILVEDGDEIVDGTAIASRGDKTIVAQRGGRILREDRHITVIYERRDEREYEIPSAARVIVENGQRVKAGDQLTEGSKNPHRILSILGREATQLYLLQEVQNVYRSQGVNINDKHFEIIIRKMLSKVQVTRSGDTDLLPGELVDRLTFAEVNAKVVEKGGRPASARPVLLGVTKAALNTESFLSAASFQHTIKVLAGAAIGGKYDYLRGLKENVIIGKKIPAGTGFRGRPDVEGVELPSETYEGVELAVVESMALEEEAEAEEEELLESETDEYLDEELESTIEMPLAAS